MHIKKITLILSVCFLFGSFRCEAQERDPIKQNAMEMGAIKLELDQLFLLISQKEKMGRIGVGAGFSAFVYFVLKQAMHEHAPLKNNLPTMPPKRIWLKAPFIDAFKLDLIQSDYNQNILKLVSKNIEHPELAQVFEVFVKDISNGLAPSQKESYEKIVVQFLKDLTVSRSAYEADDLAKEWIEQIKPFAKHNQHIGKDYFITKRLNGISSGLRMGFGMGIAGALLVGPYVYEKYKNRPVPSIQRRTRLMDFNRWGAMHEVEKNLYVRHLVDLFECPEEALEGVRTVASDVQRTL